MSIGTVWSAAEEQTALSAGANHVLYNDGDLIQNVRKFAPGGIDDVVEVAFAANIERDIQLLKLGGTLATYATNDPTHSIPFWQMVFKNIQLTS